MTEKILLVERTEVDADGHGSFLKIFCPGGETYRVGEKRRQLWEIYQNARKNEPILTTFDTYRNVEYISDARPITDEILRKAVQNLGEKTIDVVTTQRNRSTALSYSKDLVNADKEEKENLYERAERNYQFIIGGDVKDE